MWPDKYRSHMFKLIPKPRGGRRPVALFRGLFRFWGRLRVDVLRGWARHNVSQAIFQLAEGRRAADGVVRALVRGLLAQVQGQEVVD